MLEIHRIEETDYTRVGGRHFDHSWSPEGNNASMERLWNILADVSQGTLTPEFEKLYWFGGAWSSAYDIKGEMGAIPPHATIPASDANLELLLPVYKSLNHRGNVRPAVLGVWAHENQIEVAQVFMNNLDFFSSRLEAGDVYAIMRRPDKTLLASRYDNPHDFRKDYFNVIQGEQGEVLLVTNDPEYALKSYQREETERKLNTISHGETSVPLVVQRLPKFINRVWVGKEVAKSIPSIEEALK